MEGVWKPTDEFGITISNTNLCQWPDEGDLLEMNRNLHIFEVTDDGTITEQQTTEGTGGVTSMLTMITKAGCRMEMTWDPLLCKIPRKKTKLTTLL